MSRGIEQELDHLIDDLSETLHFPSAHRSRYMTHTYREKRVATEREQSAHRDYLYNKYGKFGGTWSPRAPKRSTDEPGWYRSMSREMGHPRSPTPILKNRTGTRSPSTSRPASQVSMYSSRSELRELRQRPTTPSAMSVSRPYSPYLLPDDVTQSRSKSPSYSRSVSPKRHHEKSVVIGPVTDLVTNRRIDEQNQEFYRFRDAHQGKPLDGRHGFMTYSWPYGLDIVSDDYLYSKRKPPAESPPSPKVPPPPIHRRARSVEPRVNTLRTPEPPVDFDIYSVKKNSDLNSSMRSLRHIVVDQVPVPTPPKFGTLTHGGRSPNTGPMLPSLDGPPCNLCHKPITEGRCIHAENAQYHCWHFVCSFCFKTLKQHDFVMADDSKPYCLNCFKKAFP